MIYENWNAEPSLFHLIVCSILTSLPISVSVTVMSDGVAANASGGNWKRSEDAANNKMNK